MNIMRRTVLIFLLLAAVTSRASANDLPVRVSLTLLPASTLPGLPVGFLLAITNPSAKPVVIADFASLKVTTSAGTFDAIGLGRSPSINLPSAQMAACYSSHCLTVPANGQRQLYLRFGPLLVENEFFADRRLSSPGRYDLQVTLLVLNLPGSEMTEIHTDTQTLIVQQPTASDLLVWNFLQQTSGGKGWTPADWLDTSDSVIRQIRATYPSSAYVPWLAAIVPANIPLTSELSQLDTALAANPPAALRDELLLAKGGALGAWSDHAIFNDRDADKAMILPIKHAQFSLCYMTSPSPITCGAMRPLRSRICLRVQLCSMIFDFLPSMTRPRQPPSYRAWSASQKATASRSPHASDTQTKTA
jgi:hypothetical protein